MIRVCLSVAARLRSYTCDGAINLLPPAPHHFKHSRLNMSIDAEAVKLSNLESAAGMVEPAPDEPVRRTCPRVTAVRLFNSIVIISLGIAKAVSAAKGEVAASNTLDWNSSILWGLMWGYD